MRRESAVLLISGRSGQHLDSSIPGKFRRGGVAGDLCGPLWSHGSLNSKHTRWGGQVLRSIGGDGQDCGHQSIDGAGEPLLVSSGD